jgi:hypothetical protein
MLNFLRWNRNSSGTAVMEPEQTEMVTVPIRVQLRPTIGNDELADYVKLAEKVKFAPPDLLHHRLVQFLLDNNIEVYPLASVEKYLDQKFGKPVRDESGFSWEQKWSWHPLRGEDVNELSAHKTDDENGHIERGQAYHKIVPSPVLETIDLIVTHFAGSEPALHFYVADAAVPAKERDLFLAIAAAGIDFLVIERWDEPSFRR